MSNVRIDNNRYITIIVPLLLVLSPYEFVFLKGLSLSYIAIIFMVIDLFSKSLIKKVKINFKPLLLVLALVIITLHSLMFTSIFSWKLIIQDISKTIIWGIFLSLINSKSIDVNNVIKNMVRVSFLASIYLVVQLIFHYKLLINLPNVFNFRFIIPTTIDLRMVTNFRAASFFGEPAYFSSQILVTLGILLFYKYESKRKNMLILFFVISNILSTSTTGIYLMLILLFLKLFSNKKNIFRKTLITIIIMVIVFIIGLNIDYILGNLGSLGETLKYAIEKPQYFETSSRIGGSYEYLLTVEGLQKIIGYGIGNEYIHLRTITYINSITRLILQTGYLGLTTFVIYIINLLFQKTNNMFLLYLLIIYIAKSATGGAMFSVTGIFILSIFYIFKEQSKEEYMHD